jgi:triosephosphate isomerase
MMKGLEKKFTVQANWKMNKTLSQSIDYVQAMNRGCQQLNPQIEVILCMPFTSLAIASKEVRFPQLSIGAQNVHEKEEGAYTGEISAPMLADVGCQYCVVGHSERRQYFGETDALVNQKAKALLRAGIAPVLCIGETLKERRKGLTLNQLERQAIVCLEDFSHEEMSQTVILYEPIWAIGTGNVASPQQAQEALAFIRQMLEKIFSRGTAQRTRILYGGSVNLDSLPALVQQKDVDGVGVGSASWDVHNFLKIVRSFARTVSPSQKSSGSAGSGPRPSRRR